MQNWLHTYNRKYVWMCVIVEEEIPKYNYLETKVYRKITNDWWSTKSIDLWYIINYFYSIGTIIIILWGILCLLAFLKYYFKYFKVKL